MNLITTNFSLITKRTGINQRLTGESSLKTCVANCLKLDFLKFVLLTLNLTQSKQVKSRLMILQRPTALMVPVMLPKDYVLKNSTTILSWACGACKMLTNKLALINSVLSLTIFLQLTELMTSLLP